MQGYEDVLQNQELTAAVISHLDSLRDLFACSAVSKCWRATVSNLAPTALAIPGPNTKFTCKTTDPILYLVQQKQCQGHFKNLHSLSIETEDETEDEATSTSTNELASFGQTMLAFAGMWPLTTITLHGPFKLTQFVLLLPTTLQSLHATVDCSRHDKYRPCTSLSQFEGLVSLQSLHLNFEGTASQDMVVDINVDLPNLQRLHVSPWGVVWYIDSICDLLPNLTHGAVIVCADEAQEFADLPHIQHLCLGLVKTDSNDVHLLLVEANSPLLELRMLAFSAVKMQVEIQKPDLCYDCRGSHNGWAVSNTGTQEAVCKMPRDFQSLSFTDLNRICDSG